MSPRRNFRLSPEQREDAREALLMLGDRDLSLKECVRRTLEMQGGAPTAVRTSLDAAVNAFLAAKHRDLKNGLLRAKTLEDYRQKLEWFADRFPNAVLDDFERPQLKSFFEDLEMAPGSKAAYWRSARALLKWAFAQEPPMVQSDPTHGLKPEFGKTRGKRLFLSIEEASKIMHHSGPYRAALALALFAGLRPEEIRGTFKKALTWESIDIEGKIIRIPEEIAKSFERDPRARVLEELPSNLWAWMETVPEVERKGPACPYSVQSLRTRAQAAGGFKKKLQGGWKRLKPWPTDGMRHSFATYHVALLGAPGRTSLLLGHEGNSGMLFRHYRGLATKADAERYFAIRP